MDMERSVAALLLALAAGCASDVDLQLDREAEASSSIGVLRFARVLGGAGEVQVDAIAWHPASRVVVGGTFTGTTDLGTGPVVAPRHTMGFVAAYDAMTGEPAWTQAFSGSGATCAGVSDMVVTDSGIVYAVGGFTGTVDFGTGPIDSADGCSDGFVARYAADGTALTPFIIPQASLYGAATTSDGGVVTAGYEVLSQCPWLEGGNAPTSWFLARLDPSGRIRWKLDLGEAATAERVATSPEGDVLVRGGLFGQLQLGEHSVSAARSYGSDSFVGRFSPDGNPRWLTSCVRTDDGSSCNDYGTVTLSPTGRAFSIETFRSRVNLGGTSVETGQRDTELGSTYIAELGTTGEPMNPMVLDGVTGRAIVVRDDPFEIVLAGDGAADAETGGAYVGILADGSELVAARGTSSGQAWDVAVGPAGELAVVGAFHGNADFGDGPIRAETDEHDEGNDGFIAIYDREVVESAR